MNSIDQFVFILTKLQTIFICIKIPKKRGIFSFQIKLFSIEQKGGKLNKTFEIIDFYKNE